MRNRVAYLTDLNNYFKQEDLLGNLTELEKELLRFNIGILSITGNDNCTVMELTYNHLYDLYTKKQLIPGKKYIITDYRTIYASNVILGGKALTWGHEVNLTPTYNVLVTALTKDTIDTRALILEHPRWVVEYVFPYETLPDGIKTKGQIIYLKDENNNSAGYDFKSIKFRRTLDGIQHDLYTFSNFEKGILEDSSNYNSTVNNTLKQGCINNVFLGTTFNNVFYSNSKNNTFKRGCNNTMIQWESSNNNLSEVVLFITGSFSNINIPSGNLSLSSTISKTIHKVNDKTIVSFLDPITYAYQITIL